MILVPTDEAGVLVTIGSRGYPENGVGAEVRFGEGIGGMVAEARKPIRISGLMRSMLYALATHREADAIRACRRGCASPCRDSRIPRASSACRCSCAASSSACSASKARCRYRFHEEDKASIELLGRYLAIAIENMQLHERMARRRQGARRASRRRFAAPTAAPGTPCAARSSTSRPTSASWSTASTSFEACRREFFGGC